MSDYTTERTTGRVCELSDLRLVERGALLSPVDATGAAITGQAGVGLGEFQKDDSIFNEEYQCENCGREFEDNFHQALQHAGGAK